MLIDTYLHKQNPPARTIAEWIWQFGAGLTFNSRVYEDCSIYSAQDSQGTNRLILHNRSEQTISVSLKGLGLNYKGRAQLIAMDCQEVDQGISDVELDSSFTLLLPAESVSLLLIPPQQS